jgi:hypothetical protein
MSIVVDGMASPLIVDLYPLAAHAAARGRATLLVHLPKDTIFHVTADPVRHGWVQTSVHADREDHCVAVSLAISSKETYPCTMVVKLGEDDEVIRFSAREGAGCVLDGVPKHVWVGWDLEHPGDPSRDPAWVAQEVET